MTTFDFLMQLRQAGMKIWLEEERLRCSGPEQLMTATLRGQLSERKPEIIAFLRSVENPSTIRSSLVPIQPAGSRLPFFGVPGHTGDVFGYVDLARRLGMEQPFFALQPPGLEPGQVPLPTVEEIAAVFARDILAAYPEGPYLIGGICVGGAVAYELAQQLTSDGHDVGLLVLFSTGCPTVCEPWNRTRAALYNSVGRVVRHTSALLRRAPREWRQYLLERAAEGRADQERLQQDPLRLRLAKATTEAFEAYRPRSSKFPVYMMLPDDPRLKVERALDWGLFAEDFTVVPGPPHCDMHMVMVEPHVGVFARSLDKHFDEINSALGAARKGKYN
jgi:thioesterase domain-containing protein